MEQVCGGCIHCILYIKRQQVFYLFSLLNFSLDRLTFQLTGGNEEVWFLHRQERFCIKYRDYFLLSFLNVIYKCMSVVDIVMSVCGRGI